MTAQQPSVPHDRPFGITVRADGAELAGELDVTGIDELWATLDELFGTGCRQVVLDLSRLDFLDAAGLGVLVRADRRFRDRGALLVLTGLRPAQRRLLEITGLDRVLTVR